MVHRCSRGTITHQKEIRFPLLNLGRSVVRNIIGKFIWYAVFNGIT
jgi:hypothetical protein